MNAQRPALWRHGPALSGALLPLVLLNSPLLADSPNSKDQNPTVGPEVTELPQLVVEGSRVFPAPQAWSYSEIPGFEVLSNASERNTKRFLERFQRLRSAVDICLPGANQAASRLPATLIICAQGKGLEAFLPDKTLQSEDPRLLSSVFLQKEGRVAIVVDLRASDALLEDGTTIETDPDQAFYENYFRFLIRQGIGAHTPHWLEQGLVSLFSSIDVTSDAVTIGKAEATPNVRQDPTDPEGEQTTTSFASNDFISILKRHALISLDRFFTEAVPSGSEKVFWNAQAYAFTHMCLYGDGKRYQAAFLKFAQRACREPVTEPLFKECFGRSFADMGVELRGYLEFTAHEYVQLSAKKGQRIPLPAPVTVRAATDAESGRLAGGALLLGGHAEEGHDALLAPYVRGERDPRLLSALGLAELSRGKEARAKLLLEAGFKGKAPDYDACLALSRLRLKEALSQNTLLTAEQEKTVLAPLYLSAKTVQPPAEAVGLIAETLSKGAAAPDEAEKRFLLWATQLHPKNAALVYAAAVVCRQYGFEPEASTLVSWGLKISATAEGKALFAQLRDKGPPGAASAPAP